MTTTTITVETATTPTAGPDRTVLNLGPGAKLDYPIYVAGWLTVEAGPANGLEAGGLRLTIDSPTPARPAPTAPTIPANPTITPTVKPTAP